MTSETIVQLILVSSVPIIFSILFYLFDKKTKFNKVPYWWKQIIIGLVFGAIAVAGTEFGISLSGVTVNARDAAPISAGLFFGAPAGIIAGVIGGVERYFAASWGAGTYTQIACTVATIVSGLIGAICRKLLFDNHKPSTLLAGAIGLVCEVFHMLMVFFTHMEDIEGAYIVIQNCALAMIIINTASVTVAALILNVLSEFVIHADKIDPNEKPHLHRIIQRVLAIIMVAGLFLSTFYTYSVQGEFALEGARGTFNSSLNDVSRVISNKLDEETLLVYTENYHVGDDGYILILDDNYNIISKDKEGKVDLSNYEKETLGEIRLFDTDYYFEYTKADGYFVMALMSQKQVMMDRDITSYMHAFNGVVLFAILFAFIYLLIKRRMVNNMLSVNKSLRKISEGKLRTKVNVDDTYEFAELSNDINTTVKTLRGYIDREKTRNEKEMALAKSLQYNSVPSMFPPFPSRIDIFDIYATMDTAKEVGGDFYDFFFVNRSELAILIADVSGKGIPAALFMMEAKSIINSYSETGIGPAEVFSKVNERLCNNNASGMFVTGWMGFLNIDTGELKYVNAGHNPPMIKRGKKSYEMLKEISGIMLAGMSGIKYREKTLKLESGDQMYFYTDGVTEAINKKEELFGEDRLIKVLNKNASKDAKTICLNIKESIDNFCDGMDQFDDITMISFKYYGNNYIEKHYPPKIDSINDIIEEIDGVLEENDADMKTIASINIAIDELFSNIAKYAFKGKKKKSDAVVRYSLLENTMKISFIDDGVEFNPLTHEDPDVSKSIEERGIGGLGIYMVKNSMDNLYYERIDNKNIITIIKKIK